MSTLSRRDFIAVLSAVGLAPSGLLAAAGERSVPGDSFLQGVASGDPLQDRVILWTRVTPKSLRDIIVGRWQISRDPVLRKGVRSGLFVTDITRDFTVKIDVVGLEPGQTYYYRFETRGAQSPLGRTRTLPRGTIDAVRMAFVSCSNYPYGYFNAYARIAAREDLDCVLHLGDYLYEYQLGEYVNPLLTGVRDVVPANEIVTLADYRQRHGLYKMDPDLQEAHRLHPFICVWDDHESANNSWRNGAENHNPELGEGEWEVRRRQSIRAYNEYMPIRSRTVFDERIYRRFRFGTLADLVMLDTRLHGRDLQAAMAPGAADVPSNDLTITDPARSLLGADQEQWLAEQLVHSKQRGATWRVLGQQVMMAQLSVTAGRTIINPDQWDGYAPARERLFRHLRDHGIDNNVVLTGDIHSSWCADLTPNPFDPSSYDPVTGAGVLGAEFIAPAVSSPGPFTDPTQAAAVAQQLRLVSPHLKYVELFRRGYGILNLDRERALCEIYHVPTVDERVGGEVLAASFVSEVGHNVVRPAAGTAGTSGVPRGEVRSVG